MNGAQVVLRLPRHDDAPWLYTLTNDPLWLRFIGDRNVHSLGDAVKYVDTCLQHFDKWGYGLWVVDHATSGQALGLCGLINRGLFTCPDVGFAFLANARNQGYAGKSVATLIEKARTQFKFDYLTAMTHPENLASQRLLLKQQFVIQGTFFNAEQFEQRLFRRSLNQ